MPKRLNPIYFGRYPPPRRRRPRAFWPLEGAREQAEPELAPAARAGGARNSNLSDGTAAIGMTEAGAPRAHGSAAPADRGSAHGERRSLALC
jgi:hypothetical protein